MLTSAVDDDSRVSFWPRVREFAVPASMIERATARRTAGDWAGACAAAGVEVDLHVRSLARAYGQEPAARLRADLRHLAPDLLRWHLPRIAPHGVLRPGLTVALARYGAAARDGTSALYLVARTVPAWADAGQRISLAVWDGSGGDTPGQRYPHPHPHPHRRFRFDLHRHLWDVRRVGELPARSTAPGWSASGGPAPGPVPYADLLRGVPDGRRLAVGRWADEARLLLGADGVADGPVLVRAGSRHRFLVAPDGTITPAGAVRGGPVLPDAATWVLPDLELLRAGAIEGDRLHPLVAAALVPGRHGSSTTLSDKGVGPRLVECRGAMHRIGLVGGVLAALDHDRDEIRREELLAELTGTPLPCLQAIDRAHRHPNCLADIRERLRHGDTGGALTVVENLLGPGALLRDGALREALESAARQRVTYGLFRAGMTDPRSPRRERPRPLPPSGRRSRPRHAHVH
ncbi:hypothetical protein ACFRI7_01490 [Streptomyces sp. NPDC056716]|uniref:hypothetical protein n=1 Tax=unclassified Streptomyces TaxID=2593676 RepID=UPI003674CEED